MVAGEIQNNFVLENNSGVWKPPQKDKKGIGLSYRLPQQVTFSFAFFFIKPHRPRIGTSKPTQNQFKSMNNIQIFKNEQFGEIRTVVNESGEPMFSATDVCNALGYSNSRKAIADHTDAEERCNISLHRGGEMTFISESGLYSLIIRSNKTEAKPFRKWVTSEILPSIRKHGYYVNPKQVNKPTSIKVRTSLEWVKGVREILNLNDSSTLFMLKQVGEPLGLPLPNYTPSQGQLLSASELLSRSGSPMTTQDFNKKMIAAGYITVKERPSSRGKTKNFKSITPKGSMFGENQVCPNNPKETQPLYYADKFDRLLESIGSKL